MYNLLIGGIMQSLMIPIYNLIFTNLITIKLIKKIIIDNLNKYISCQILNSHGFIRITIGHDLLSCTNPKVFKI